jgi:hypothetical protein
VVLVVCCWMARATGAFRLACGVNCLRWASFADELGHRDYVTGRIWDNGKYPVRLILNKKSSDEIEWHCKH